MSNKLPKQLSEKQELLRQQTINRVLHAITDIKTEGGVVTIAALVEFTGLSRSVFAKPHIRELLTEYGYNNHNEVVRQARRQGKPTKQTKILKEKDIQIARLQFENTELRHECELLRGRLFLMMQQQQG